MKHYVYLLSAILVLALKLDAQTIRPGEPIRLTVDLARFRGADDSTGYFELYYSVPQRSLTYRADTNGFSGAIDLQAVVRRGDSVFYRDRWTAPSRIKDTADLQRGLNLVGVCQVGLPKGEFLLRVVAADMNEESRKDSVAVRFTMQPPGSDRIIMSDLELASTIRKSAQKTPFYKNTLEVVPDVGALYSAKQTLYYYAEVYNLLLDSAMTNFFVRCSVTDAIGRVKFTHDRPKKRMGESQVIVDQVALNELKTGTYTMALSLMDSAKHPVTSVTRKFFVLNEQLGTDSTLLAANSTVPLAVYSSMNEEELDTDFNEAKYTATETERDQWQLLKGADAKRAFMSAFWRKRPVGYRDTYMARVEYANANYRNMKTPGYRSDRGRVYIVYGPPDDNERHPSESDSRAYEIWSYHNIQGGVIFVFVQRSTTGEYDLVHSTDRNELHDDNWQRYLNPNADQNPSYINNPPY